MGNYVIFSIDNCTDVHVLAKFLRHVDTKRALGYMRGEMKLCLESYEGVLEQSFLMRRDDFDAIVQPFGYVDGQECLMVVSGKRMHSWLLYSDGDVKPLGYLKQVTKDQALAKDAWTYRMDINAYFIIEE